MTASGVGEDSKIPNQGGIRTALVEALGPLRPAVIRWPGGCFADSYNWRDGVGPRARRPRRANFWINELKDAPDGPYKYEPNHFGTNEFMRFTKAVGAQPYLAANVRSLPANDFNDWVEYCNAPAGATTLAELRAAAGDREPFGVRYWGVGNESWGCGGDLTPDDYAREYRRYTAFVPTFGSPLRFIAAGPTEATWTGRAASFRSWPKAAAGRSTGPSAGPCITTRRRAARAGRWISTRTTGTPCWPRQTAWRASSRATGRPWVK